MLSEPLINNPHIEVELVTDESRSLMENTARGPSNHPLLFILLGTSGLLFFNLIINAIDIYVKVTHEDHIGTLLSQVYNIPCSIMALVICFFKPRNLRFVIILSGSVLVILLCILPVILLVNASQKVTYWATLVIVGVAGVSSQALFSSGFSLSSQFSAASVGYVSNGNGLCGVLAFVLRCITKALFSKDEQLKVSTACYFFFGAGIIAFQLIVYIVNLRKPDVKAASIITNDEKPPSIFSKHTWEIIKLIYPLWLAQFGNFLITLSMFPGYLYGTLQKYGVGDWTGVIVTGVFCIFDWLGRYLPAVKIFPSEKWAWLPVALRLLFYPIFILSLQGVIKGVEPIWTWIFDALFAITNGYHGTVVMIYGNSKADLSPDDRKFAAFLMSFAINAGIFFAMFLAQAMPTPHPK